MNSSDLSAKLGKDQFALYFGGEGHIPADLLGNFLRRVSTVTRRRGVDLEVVAFEPGSLAVVLKALQKTKRGISTEFQKAPVATTAAGASLVSLAVGAIVAAMATAGHGTTPLEHSGAQIVINGNADNILIVTSDKSMLLMDRTHAGAVQEQQDIKKGRLPGVEGIQLLVEEGKRGRLRGTVVDVHGRPFFRPERCKFLVPIQFHMYFEDELDVVPDGRYEVSADLHFYNGQPGVIVIYRAQPL